MPGAPLTASRSTAVTLPDGRNLRSFGGCNYLALANHPAAIRAVREAQDRYGLSSTASRETTGNTQAHEALERDLAAFLGVETALLTPDGYIANIAACQGLRARARHAVLDERAHASLADAARTAGMALHRFSHGDPEDLAAKLARLHPEPVIVLTDGVFTADGDPAPVGRLLDALGPDDRLVVDDCHGLGVIGPGGRGSTAHAGVSDPRVLITSSLAKGLGCAGGVIAGAGAEVLPCRAATAYLCTTPIAPSMAEGTSAALAVLIAEPERVERLARNGRRLRSRLHALGIGPAPRAPHTPVAAFTLGDREQMSHAAASLEARGFRVPLIAYPGGPAPSFFRVTVNAEHSERDIDDLADAIAQTLDALTERPASIEAGARLIG